MPLKSNLYLIVILFFPLSSFCLELKVGDLVFRKDSSLTSDIFSIAGKFPDREFSHVGIISSTTPTIVHHVYDKGENALQKDNIKEFTRDITLFGVFRFRDLDQYKFIKSLQYYSNRKWSFDYSFSRKNNSLYSSEFN